MNLKIRMFEQSLVNLINQTDLPIEVKRITMENIFQKVCKEADRITNNELNEKLKEKGEENGEEND